MHTPHHFLMMAYNVVFNTGLGFQKWKTQDNFKIHFTTSHHEIQETIHNSHATGYSANFMSDKGIKETENEMVTSLAKLATTETAEKQVIKNQQQ